MSQHPDVEPEHTETVAPGPDFFGPGAIDSPPSSGGSASEPVPPAPVDYASPLAGTPTPVVPGHGSVVGGYPGPGYPQQPPPPSLYGAPGAYPVHPYIAEKPEHPSSTTVLVLGIIGIFIGICAPIAWFMGSQAKRQIKQGAPYEADASLIVGHVLGIVFTLLNILFWGMYAAAIVAAILVSF